MSARVRTAVLVNLAMVVEQANEQVLPAVYLFVGRSLNATPVQLGTLTLCRAMVQTLASPLSGVLGDRYDRVLVLSSGAFIWGIMTSAMALTVTLHQAMAFAAFNGLGLALLVPCCQSLIADLYPAEQRGRAFGTLQLTASLGGMLGGVFATNMGGLRLAGMDGWRAAFHCIAALSLVVGALVLFFAADPRRLKSMQYSLLPAADVCTLLASGSLPHSPNGAAAQPRHAAAAAAPAAPPEKADSSINAARGAGDTFPGMAGLLERRRSFHHRSGSGSGNSSSGVKGRSFVESAAAHGVENGLSSGHALSGPQHVAVAVNTKAGEQLLFPDHEDDPTNLRDQQQQPGVLTVEHWYSKHSPHQHEQQQQQQRHAQRPEPSAAVGAARPRVRQVSPNRLPLSSSTSSSSWEDVGGPGAVQKHPDEAAEDVRGRSKPRKRSIAGDICWMLQIRTFQAIVLQGIVGCFPWQAMVFFTLWLQLTGFSDSTASLLVATFGAGVAGGALLGGAVGDRMAKRLPNNGRILTAQVSVFCGIPLTWLLLKGLPGSALAAEPLAFATVMFSMGLTCTWAGAGCNSPIFAEIVPDELRSTIYAFDRSFENSIAACAAPVVGLLAERVFGFNGVLSDAALKDDELRRHNASALGSSLLACMTIPWSLCLVFYTALHFFYPKDKAMARTWGSGSSNGSALMYH